MAKDGVSYGQGPEIVPTSKGKGPAWARAMADYGFGWAFRMTVNGGQLIGGAHGRDDARTRIAAVTGAVTDRLKADRVGGRRMRVHLHLRRLPQSANADDDYE